MKHELESWDRFVRRWLRLVVPLSPARAAAAKAHVSLALPGAAQGWF